MRSAGDGPSRLTAVADLRDFPEILAGLEAGPIRLHGLGRSMYPLIRPGDSVELVADSTLRPGAVYLGELPDGRFVVHRLIARKNGMVMLRGDFNSRSDPPIPESSLRARAIRVWREGRPLEMDALLPRAYGLFHVTATPWVAPARGVLRRARRAALEIATGPMLPVTRGLARAGTVERVGLDSMERHLVSLSAAGLPVDPARALRTERALRDGSAALLRIAGTGNSLAAIAEVAPYSVEGVDHPGARIDGVWVAPLYRHRTLERAIVREAVAWARERGLTELWLDTRIDDREARASYEQEGFHRTEASSFVESRIARPGVVALCRML